MAIRLSPCVYNPVDSVDISRLFFSGLKIPLVFPILYTRYEQVIHDKSTGYAHNENGAHWEGTNMKADQLQFAGIETVKTQCGCCGKVIELTEAVISTHIITPSLTETEHFCSDRCAEIEWRMRWCTTVSTARSTSQSTNGDYLMVLSAPTRFWCRSSIAICTTSVSVILRSVGPSFLGYFSLIGEKLKISSSSIIRCRR